MTTIAEGVETPEQFEILAKLGCDQSQGYLHGRPMSAADMEPLLRNGSPSGAYLALPTTLLPTPIARRG